MKRVATLAGIAALYAAPAFAHPGHGVGGGYSLLHYATSPEHVGLALLALVVVAGALALTRRRAR